MKDTDIAVYKSFLLKLSYGAPGWPVSRFRPGTLVLYSQILDAIQTTWTYATILQRVSTVCLQPLYSLCSLIVPLRTMESPSLTFVKASGQEAVFQMK